MVEGVQKFRIRTKKAIRKENTHTLDRTRRLQQIIVLQIKMVGNRVEANHLPLEVTIKELSTTKKSKSKKK